jgi:Ca2+-binding RTX toxin-like protein
MATGTQMSLSSNSLVNGLLWDGWKYDTTHLTYYFADDHYSWTELEKSSYVTAMASWTFVVDLTTSESQTRSAADFVEIQVDNDQMANTYQISAQAFHETPDGSNTNLANSSQNPNIGANEINGVYSWQIFPGVSWTGNPLLEGGYASHVTIHELGHALGLKHPHDVQGSAQKFPGVTNFGDLGDNNLNHMLWTVMSYNRDYGFDTNGEIVLRSQIAIVKDSDWLGDYGYVAGPMAFDIAALQHLYGASSANTGDDVYYLPVNNTAGEAMWRCIWDTGGTDTMQYDGTNGTIISLHAATLDNSAEGGGVASYARFTYGGFTIANGVEIENATGGSGDDEIIGNNIANHLIGRAGADTIYGELGDDTLDGGAEDAAADMLTGGFGLDTLYGRLGDDTLYGDYKDVYDQGDADQLYGGGGKDSIQGGGGDDYLYGDDGSDEDYVLGDDRDFIHGGIGNDHIWGGGANDTVYGGLGTDSLYGGDDDDLVYGENDGDFIDGGFGSDSLFGGAGVDTIYGGAVDSDYIEAGNGGDTVDAGYGDDTVYGDNLGDVSAGGTDYLKAGGGKDTVYGGGGDDYIYGDFDYLDSTDGDPNKYTPGADDDVLLGEGGNDQIYGGGGNDKLYGGDETGQYDGDGLYGGDGNDTLYGGLGIDVLVGGKGQDAMEGSLGNDSYYVDNKNDIATEGKNQGTDYLYSSTYSYTMTANVEYMMLLDSTDATRAFGSDTNNNMYGNSNDNLLEGNGGMDFIMGYAGADVLKGGAGHDYLLGGVCNDSYYVDASDIDEHVHEGYVSISELKNEGTRDVVYTTTSMVLADDQEIETIYLQAGAVDVSGNKFGNRIVGNSADNEIFGFAGIDTISGGGGRDRLKGGDDQDFLYGEDDNDVLDGGKHDDELTGGEGRDSLKGGTGNDDFVFDHPDDTGKTKGSADVILDFAHGDDIDLSGFSGKFGWAGASGFSGKGAEAGYQRTSGGVLALIDADGDGKTDLMIFCKGLTALDKGDFVL